MVYAFGRNFILPVFLVHFPLPLMKFYCSVSNQQRQYITTTDAHNLREYHPNINNHKQKTTRRFNDEGRETYNTVLSHTSQFR